MEFGLLGPLVVRHDEQIAPVQRGNQRALLALLLLNANRAVTVDEIAETLWGTSPPPSAQVTIRNYVKRLRQALGDVDQTRISSQPRGYLIRADDDEIDLSRFETLLTTARAAARDGSWATAATQARAALSLWRGAPLADVESDALTMHEVPRLTELRLEVLELRIDADMHLGRHADVTAELRPVIRDNPLREQFYALLMLALYRCGQQSDSLAVYQQARQLLVDELGVEPGTALRKLHQQILAADPALNAPEPTAPGPARPRELPAPPPHFIGRTAELAALTSLLDKAPGTLLISAIAGMAGVGKTALALHWAHEIAHRFPDGQLYVNLHGFDPSGVPAPPSEAIRGFLDALDVPANRIPRDLAAQARLYRTLLAGKRILIVLDNARDDQQVRPLLPSSPGCLVIVTSRNQLAGLAATDGAHLLAVDVLPDTEARELLTVRLGAERAAFDPEAIAEITGLSGRLPLALAVAAARAAARPRFPLAALAAELRGADSRLDALDTGDPAASVRAVFSWSSQQLSSSAAGLFRLLGLYPGPDVTVSAAASLAGVSPADVRRDLSELAWAHLLTEHAPGRYAFHDLVRSYAAEQAKTTYDAPARRDAIGRFLDHYLHTARAAALLIAPAREQVAFAPPRPGVTLGQLDDSGQALAWFEAEHRVLLAAIALAAQTGFDTHAWQLPWTTAGFLTRRGYWDEEAAIQRTALAAATRLGDIAGQAISGRLLASACVTSGDYDEARTRFADCLELYQQLDDKVGQALVNQNLSVVTEHQGHYRAALGHAEQALQLFQATGHQAGLGPALNSVGWCHIQLGDFQQARTFCREAIAANHEAGNLNNEAAAWDSLGYAQQRLGDLTEAATSYRQALSLAHQAGDRLGEAEALTHLGDNCQAVGDLTEAREAWQQALGILDDLRHPNADGVRARLSSGQLSDVAKR